MNELKTNHSNTELWWKFFLVAVVSVGVFARLFALASAPLIDDEYYTARSISNLIEFGFPQFETGGYYTRGLLQQYLTAPLIILGITPELALRLVPALSSILALPAVYILGMRIGGLRAAVIATAFMSLSLWEIEFARFIRMYSPFQALFLWYLVYLSKGVIEDDDNSLLVAYAISFFSIFVYVASVFLLLFNFIPLLMGKRVNIIHCVVPIILLVISQLVKLPMQGDVPKLPENLISEMPSYAGGVEPMLPKLLVFQLLSTPAWLLVFVPLILYAVYVAFRLTRNSQRLLLSTVLLVTSVGALTLGLFGAAVACVAAALLLDSSYSTEPKNTVRQNIKTMWLLVLACGLFWLAYCFVESGWKGNVTGAKEFLKYPKLYVNVVGALFNYPEVLTRFVKPLLDTTPITIAFYFVSIAIGYCVYLFDNSVRSKYYALVFAVLVASVMLVGLTGAFFKTTRYFFFLYPLLLILAAAGIAGLFSHLSKNTSIPSWASGLVCVLAIVIAEDFSLGHIADIDQDNIIQRVPYKASQAAQLLPRRDMKAPVTFVNERLSLETDIVITDLTVVDYYLNKPLDYIFLSKEHKKFWERSVLRGTKDRWSNSDLIYDIDVLEQLIAEQEKRVWLIVYAKKWNGEAELAFRELYGDQLVFESSDGTVDVFLID